MLRILVPTTGHSTAAETADYAMQVARATEAEVVALHVLRPGHSREAGELALEYFQSAGVEHDVNVESHFRQGVLVDQIIEFAEDQSIDLILMGASQGVVVDQWISSDVRYNTVIPVLVIPYQMFE